MSSKKILAVFAITALVLAFVVNSQAQSNLVQNLNTVVVDLTQIIGGLGRILTNPAVLLNGQLGGNVGDLVDRIVVLVGALLTTVTDLLQTLGLST